MKWYIWLETYVNDCKCVISKVVYCSWGILSLSSAQVLQQMILPLSKQMAPVALKWPEVRRTACASFDMLVLSTHVVYPILYSHHSWVACREALGCCSNCGISSSHSTRVNCNVRCQECRFEWTWETLRNTNLRHLWDMRNASAAKPCHPLPA